MIHVVSVRVGQKYGPEYVLRLHDMIARNLREDQKHYCLTDDPDSLPEGIAAIPANPALEGWWQKCFLFSPEMPWDEGDEILYMDLDVCVTGRLEGLLHGIIQDWYYDCYNSSVMRWRHGEHRAIWNLLPRDVSTYGGDQDYIKVVSDWQTFPPHMFVSYRKDAVNWPPEGCTAVIFHGRPNPHEITTGWVPDVWKVGGYTSLPVMDGMNVSDEFAYDNIRQNVKRDLEWFSGFDTQGTACVIVAGGPSMKENVKAIKDHKRRGARIVTVNNALGFLLSKGVKPDAHVMLDARADNVGMVEDAPKDIRYFLASQVHPCVFDALSGHDVVLWHSGMHDGEELWSIVKPWEETKPIVFVPGGGTVGLRTLYLAWLSGYRKIHLYGFDSCYHGEDHHAYAQSLNDDDATQTVVMGDKTYRAARWMVRQAMEFKDQLAFLKDKGVKVFVHGRGLIPDIWKALK